MKDKIRRVAFEMAFFKSFQSIACSMALTCVAAGLSDRAAITRSVHSVPLEKHFLKAALRPGGIGLAYVIGRDSTADSAAPATLYYKDLERKTTIAVATGAKSGADGNALHIWPIWSPDGSVLAYPYPDAGTDNWHIHLWWPDSRSDVRLPYLCLPYDQAIRWSPGSRIIYFVREPDDLREQEGDQEKQLNAGEQPNKNPRTNGNGITVWSFDNSDKSAHPPAHGMTIIKNNEVISADIQTGTVISLFHAAGISWIHLSPDGLNLLAKTELGYDKERQNYSDWYLVRVPNTAGRGAGSHSESPLHTTRILTRTKFLRAAWAPDSMKVAFNEWGVLSGGDLFVYDLGSKSLTNITPSPLPREDGEAPLRTRSLYDSGLSQGKFASSAGIEWTTTGDAIYALRKTLLAYDCRSRLWMVKVDGSVKNLTAGASYDAALPLPDFGGLRIVPIRQPDGRSGFAELSEKSGGVETITMSEGEFYSNEVPMFHEDTRTGDVVFVASNTAAPQEAFVFDPRNHLITQVTAINKDFKSDVLPLVREVNWVSQSGPHWGDLYLPRGYQGKAPLIVQVYPRERTSSVDRMDFAGRQGIFLSGLGEMMAKGYAIFKPNLPVVGGGKTCDDVAANLESALQTIQSNGWADTERVALVGHSFGGWTVNCVITRSHRFRAAISLAGVSDLISLSFSFNPKAQTWSAGGGQTDINKSIWDANDLYWYESPVASSRNVTTPLLLMHGTADTTVPISQSFEMYSALSALGKTVSLVTYEGADHGSILNNPDVISRIEMWIEKYLGKPNRRAKVAGHKLD